MRRFLYTVLLVLAALWSAGAQNTSVKKLESQRAQLEKDIALLNRKLDQNSKNSQEALSGLTLVRRKISAREQLIAGYDQQLKILGDSLHLCQQDIDRLQARHDTLSLYYSRLVRGAYKNRDSRLWYMYVLASSSLGQAFNRFAYLRNLSSQMGDQALKAHLHDGVVHSIVTKNLDSHYLEASHFILASGGYFSKGLISNPFEVYEPVFGVDVDFAEDRNTWYHPDFAADQPYMRYGVKTDASLRALLKGEPVKNLYAIGSILGETRPELGSAAGLAIRSAFLVVDEILRRCAPQDDKSDMAQL